VYRRSLNRYGRKDITVPVVAKAVWLPLVTWICRLILELK